MSACVLPAALIGGIVYWLEAREYQSTDDAFVAARAEDLLQKGAGTLQRRQQTRSDLDAPARGH
ncbi:hypothetical protein [Bradyrhizobium cenepequi]